MNGWLPLTNGLATAFATALSNGMIRTREDDRSESTKKKFLELVRAWR